MNQAELVIQDFKNQIVRLSEERAIYFALATHREQEINMLNQENEKLKQENENMKTQLDSNGAGSNES